MNHKKGVAVLTAEQYRVTQERGTEAPFTGRYHAHKDSGMYRRAEAHWPALLHQFRVAGLQSRRSRVSSR